jgi:hypothetical protein
MSTVSSPGKLARSWERAHEHVAGVLPLREGQDLQALGQFGGDVLGAVDGQVDGAVEEGLLDLLDEEAPIADAGEGRIQDLVT